MTSFILKKTLEDQFTQIQETNDIVSKCSTQIQNKRMTDAENLLTSYNELNEKMCNTIEEWKNVFTSDSLNETPLTEVDMFNLKPNTLAINDVVPI